MNPTKSKDKVTDLITESVDIKRVVCDIINKNKIPVISLCKKHKINSEVFRSKYLNTKSFQISHSKIPQYKLINLLEDIGVNIKLHVVIKEIDAKKLKEELKEF